MITGAEEPVCLFSQMFDNQKRKKCCLISLNVEEMTLIR